MEIVAAKQQPVDYGTGWGAGARNQHGRHGARANINRLLFSSLSRLRRWPDKMEEVHPETESA